MAQDPEDLTGTVKDESVKMAPTRAEARALFLTVQAFWFSAGIGFGLLSASPWLLPIILGGMACGFAFYVVAYRVAARELGRPATSFWFPWGLQNENRRPFLQQAVESYTVLFKLASPLWWHRTVAPATGWPVPLVDVLMVLGLAAALLGGPLFSTPDATS